MPTNAGSQPPDTTDAPGAFVRCIKPNHAAAAASFESQTVLTQLRQSGVIEAVRISRAGYPIRLPFDGFLSEFHSLAGNASVSPTTCSECHVVGSSVTLELAPTESGAPKRPPDAPAPAACARLPHIAHDHSARHGIALTCV